MTFTTTPEPFRNTLPAENDYSRRSLEQELWDSLANDISITFDTTLDFVMPVDGRVEILARADIDAAADLTLNLDGTNLTPSSFGNLGATVIVIAAPNVLAGRHTITLLSLAFATITDPVIILRRGRKGN